MRPLSPSMQFGFVPVKKPVTTRGSNQSADAQSRSSEPSPRAFQGRQLRLTSLGFSTIQSSPAAAAAGRSRDTAIEISDDEAVSMSLSSQSSDSDVVSAGKRKLPGDKVQGEEARVEPPVKRQLLSRVSNHSCRVPTHRIPCVQKKKDIYQHHRRSRYVRTMHRSSIGAGSTSAQLDFKWGIFLICSNISIGRRPNWQWSPSSTQAWTG